MKRKAKYKLAIWIYFAERTYSIDVFKNNVYCYTFELHRFQRFIAHKLAELMGLKQWQKAFDDIVEVPEPLVRLLIMLSVIQDQDLKQFNIMELRTLEEVEGWLSLLFMLSDKSPHLTQEGI